MVTTISAIASGAALLAGLAAQDITPARGVPLGGFGDKNRRVQLFKKHEKSPYSTFLKPSEGELDPIRAKALVLRRAEHRLLFLSLDVVGVSAEFHDDLLKRLPEFLPEEVLISATHTHSGPGAIAKSPLWELAVMDLFKRKVYERFVDGIVETVRRAEAALEPARLYAATFQADGLQRNRRHQPGHFDPTANLLLARSERGAWLGGLTNLAIHGTALGSSNLKFSADVPGGIERALEAALGARNLGGERATIVFLNGAEGDVSPTQGGVDGIEAIGAAFTAQAMESLASAREISPEWTIRRSKLKLRGPRLNPDACVDKPWFHKLVSRKLFVSLFSLLPHEAPLTWLRLGDLSMMTWPGEPTTTLGLALKAASGSPNAWVLGLTNSHLSYFTTPDEFRAGGYESCASFYGPHAGEAIVREYARLFHEGKK